MVILDTFDADGLKSPPAHVQSNLCGLGAALADPVEDFRSEMKSSRRSSNGSASFGIDGLVALAIAGRIRTGDVRRKRDMTDAIEGGEEIRQRLEANAALAKFRASQNLGLQLVVLSEVQAFADADFAPRPDQAFPLVGVCG